MRKLLFIDDQWEHWIGIIGKAFADKGWSVVHAGWVEEGLALLESGDYEAVLLDLEFPGRELQGKDALKAIRRRYPELPVIVLTGSSAATEIRTAVSCVKLGARDYFVKSDLDLRHLIVETQMAADTSAVRKRQDNLIESSKRLAGPTPHFKCFEYEGKYICTFATRILAVGARQRTTEGILTPEAWMENQFDWQRRFIAGLLSPIPGREIELRLLVIPGDSDHRLEIAIIGRGVSAIEQDSRNLAEELWVDVESLLRMNKEGYSFEPVKSSSELMGLLVPFKPERVVEFQRTGQVFSTRRALGFKQNSVEVTPQPFVVPSDLPQSTSTLLALCQALNEMSSPTLVSVVLNWQSVELPPLDRIDSSSAAEASPAQVATAVARLERLSREKENVCRVRMTVASEGIIPGSVLRTVAGELISDDDSLWRLVDFPVESSAALFDATGSLYPDLSSNTGLESVFTVSEVTNVFRLPVLPYGSVPGIPTLRPHYVYLPKNLPDSGSLLGVKPTSTTATPVRISENDRSKHVYILGQTGTGKSTMLQSMILSDIRENRGMCVIDPHGDLIDYVIPRIPKERIPDVILFDPSDVDFPIGLNLLEASSESEKDFLSNELVLMLQKEFDPNKSGIVGPQFEQATRAGARTVMDFPEGGTVVDIPRLFENTAYLKYRLTTLQDPTVRYYWEDVWMKKAEFHKSEFLGWLTSKFERFRQNGVMRRIIGQSKCTFDFRSAMDEGKIVLVNLSKGGLGELNSSFLGTILTTRIFAAAMSRQELKSSERLPFSLYLDEFQNFTTDTVKSMLGEARKYGLALVFANQNLHQLPEKIREAVLGNVGSTVFFRPGVPDAERLAMYLRPEFETKDLLDLPNWHVVGRLLIGNAPSKPFVFQTTLDLTDEDPQLETAILAHSRCLYGRSRDVVDKEIEVRQMVTESYCNRKIGQ